MEADFQQTPILSFEVRLAPSSAFKRYAGHGVRFNRELIFRSGGMNYYLLPDPPYSNYDSYLESGVGAVVIARSLSPPEIVNQITRSGLRGRGGAGFPAGIKWKTIFNHPCPKRYV